MIREARFIAVKDLRFMLFRKETIIWTFIMPIIFFYFIGTVTGGFGAGEVRKDRIALRIEEGQAGFLADQLVHRLEEQDYEVSFLDDPAEFDLYRRRLVLPNDFTQEVLAGEQVKIRIVGQKDTLGGSFDQIRITQAVYSVLADLVVTGEDGQPPSVESFAELNRRPHNLTLEVSPAGERKKIPSGFEQAIPGNMVMFTLLVLLTSGTVLLVLEREEGLLRRLASAPMTRGSIVLGKWVARLGLALVQIGFAMVAGTVLFGMNWGQNLAAVCAMLAAWAAFNATLSILLGSLVRTQGQASGLGVITSLAMGALGGCWWPIEVVPSWMQKMALFLPSGWAMNGMHKLVSFGASPGTVIPNIVALLAGTVLLGFLATRYFKFD
jgi:ABC-2 type transport system permease protein